MTYEPIRRGDLDKLAEDVTARYAEFGERVAVILGSKEEWAEGPSRALEQIESAADELLPIRIATDDMLDYWRERADKLGIEHDGPREEPDDPALDPTEQTITALWRE